MGTDATTPPDAEAELRTLVERATAPVAGDRPAAAPPARAVAVVTCMDARIDPLRDLGLALGDAHVIRVAGGRVNDEVLRSLHLSTAALGTRACLLVTHTACGLQDRDGTLPARLAELDPGRAEWGTFRDPAAAVREDVERLLAWEHRPQPWAVAGAVLDVADGSLEVVVPVTAA